MGIQSCGSDGARPERGAAAGVQTLLRARTASSSVLLAFEKEKYKERERLKEAEFVGGF